jgi:hypothetical protein
MIPAMLPTKLWMPTRNTSNRNAKSDQHSLQVAVAQQASDLPPSEPRPLDTRRRVSHLRGSGEKPGQEISAANPAMMKVVRHPNADNNVPK